MKDDLDQECFKLQKPWCPGLSQELLDAVNEGYKDHVVIAVQSVLKNNIMEAIK